MKGRVDEQLCGQWSQWRMDGWISTAGQMNECGDE